jgi:hypothetical protein
MDTASTSTSRASRDLSIGPSKSVLNLPNAFSQIMGSVPREQRKDVRDRCNRPVPTYNQNYNPYEPPPEDRRPNYSLYTPGEPLHNNRAVIIVRLPRKYVITGATKRKRTVWVWQLGYALTNTSKRDKPTVWVYKLYIPFYYYIVIIYLLVF